MRRALLVKKNRSFRPHFNEVGFNAALLPKFLQPLRLKHGGQAHGSFTGVTHSGACKRLHIAIPFFTLEDTSQKRFDVKNDQRLRAKLQGRAGEPLSKVGQPPQRFTTFNAQNNHEGRDVAGKCRPKRAKFESENARIRFKECKTSVRRRKLWALVLCSNIEARYRKSPERPSGRHTAVCAACPCQRRVVSHAHAFAGPLSGWVSASGAGWDFKA